jgi:2-oxoglutarate ferredoxin oxidoreductase subunit alpha
VLIDIQRAGPSTGQATRPAQNDILQVRWGNHGGFPIIALCPSTAQEYLEMTIRAFNLAEVFRVPVFLLGDEVIGHAREKVTIAPQYEVLDRFYAKGETPFDTDHESLVPSMPKFGDREKLLVTGSTHDAGGLRKSSSAQVQERLTYRFTEKINKHRELIVRTRADRLDDASIVFITFGAAHRSAISVVNRLREKGRKVGVLKIETIWPMAQKQIRELDRPGVKIIIPEMNNGQYAREVQRLTKHAEVFSYTQQDGEAIKPATLLAFAEERI